MTRHVTRGFRWVAAASLSALLLLPSAVDAQRSRDGRPGGQDRARLEQRIRAQMARMIEERLDLDEEESAALSAVVQDFEEQRRALAREEAATRRRVQDLMEAGNGDDEEARDLIRRLSELRVEEAELFGAEQEALMTVLTPGQVLELQSLRQDLGRRIRALRGGRGDDSPRRRGRGR